MPYSEKFKLRMIQRLTGPNAPSASQLSREVGVPQPTLSLWLRRVRRLPSMKKDERPDAPRNEPRSSKSWSAEDKYRLVLEAATIPDAELGEFLRKNGLHAVQLEDWRRVSAAAATSALTPGRKRARAQPTSDARRIRELERELLRKDKALAELAAIITLKKKLALYFGDEDGSTPKRIGP